MKGETLPLYDRSLNINILKVPFPRERDFFDLTLINPSYQPHYMIELSFKNAKFARNLILIASALCQLSAIKSWVKD